MKTILFAATIFFILSCGPSHGVMNKEGFFYKDYGYSVLFKQPTKRHILDWYWYIDNWKFQTTTPAWSLKDGRNYLGYRIVDKDDDGTLERERVYFFDLLIKHKTTDGVIWIQSFDLQHKNKWKKLGVLLDNYVDSLAGTGMYIEGNVYSILQKKERKYASNVIKTEPADLGPYKALRATIELIDLDQLKAVPDYKGKKLEVVIVKINVTRKVKATTSEHLVDTVSKTERAVMLIGYHNSAKHFDKYLKDFDEFLGRIKIDDPAEEESEDEAVAGKEEKTESEKPQKKQHDST